MLKKIRYILEIILLFFCIFILRIVGLNIAKKISGGICKIIGPILPVSNVAMRNLEIAFPKKSKKEKKQILKATWENLGFVAAEFVFFSKIQKNFSDYATIKNKKRLLQFKNNNEAVISFSGHFANWETLLLSVNHLKIPFSFFYRQTNNPYFDKKLKSFRNKYNISLIAKGKQSAKELLKTIKNKGNVGMLVDQKDNRGIEVDFFGQKVKASPAIAECAVRYKTPLIPSLVIRKEDGTYNFNIEKPLETDGKTAAEIMQDIYSLLEKWIRKNPEQWFWLHRRFDNKIYQ